MNQGEFQSQLAQQEARVNATKLQIIEAIAKGQVLDLKIEREVGAPKGPLLRIVIELRDTEDHLPYIQL